MKMARLFLLASLMLLCSFSMAQAGLHAAPYSYAFTGWATTIDDWTNSGTTQYLVGSTGYWHDAANSCKFDTQSDFIVSPTIDNPDTVKVWLRGASTDSMGVFKVFAQQGSNGFNEIRTCIIHPTGDIRATTWVQLILPLGPSYRGQQNVTIKFVYTTKVRGNIAMDDFSVTAVPAATTEQDARLQAGGVGAQATISSLLVNPSQTAHSFQIRDEGTGASHLNTIINALQIAPAAGNTATPWTDYLAGAELTDGVNTYVGTISVTGISFAGAPLMTLPDGGAWQTFSLNVWLKTTLPYNADNKILDFSVLPGSFTTDTLGAAFNPADAAVESGVANNRVDIVATKLSITTQPAAIVNANTNFTVRAGFTDIYGGIDQDWAAETISLSLANGTGVLSAVTGLDKISTAGQSAWTDLRYNQAETGVRIQAVSESFPDAVPTSFFDVWLEASIVIDTYPLYWDGTADSSAVPFAVHISVANWIIGANQDVYLKVYSGSNNPFHYTETNGWSANTNFAGYKPIVHLDDHGSWSGWLPLKSKGMTSFAPRVALVTNSGTNFTGAAITGTLLNIAPAGNGAIIENRTTSYARPGYIVLVRNDADNITGLWIAEDNGFPLDDGGTPLPERGWRLASLAFCEQATFEAWAPENWPGHGSYYRSEIKPDWCVQPGETHEASDVVLPVELLGAPVATAGDGSVTLSWATATENENARFEIVRDGRIVGVRTGAGSSSSRHDYSWTENDLTNGNEYSYTLRSVSSNGDVVDLASNLNATPTLGAVVITEYALRQNYPNPFNPTTSISFDLVEAGQVNLLVYNLMGQEVASLVNGQMISGRHIVSFDAANLPSGVYVYRLNVNGFVSEKKMLLMK